MKKSDLKTGMIVELVDEDINRLMVIEDGCGEMFLCGIVGYADLNDYKEDLTHEFIEEISIVKVFENDSNYSIQKMLAGDCSGLELIWQREEEQVDWSKVKTGTPILVRDYLDEEWYDGIFVAYYNNKIVSYSESGDFVVDWFHGRLK